MNTLHLQPGRPLTHELPRQAFDELCSGGVTEKFVTAVDASQYSSRKLLLRGVFEHCAEHPAVLGPLTDSETLWNVLVTAEERDPTAIREIMTHPTAGVWLARLLGRFGESSPDTMPLWAELGYLHSLVAVAAIRTGVPCDIRLPVVHGFVTLPMLGCLELPTNFPAGFADLRHSESGTFVTVGHPGDPVTLDSTHFLPVHRHVSVSRGVRFAVEINDSDPYRELSTPLPPRPLSKQRRAEWAKMLDEAFDLLTQWHPEYARELSAGLRMVTPLPADGPVRGASSSVAIGCVAVSEKPSATLLAETLVHEFQHSKLNGLLTLFDIGHQDNLYAPWRDDPRPLPGLVHGVLAFFSVAEFWQVERELVPDHQAKAAHFTFALRRQQVAEAIRALRRESALTRLGQALVEAIDRRFSLLARQPVPSDVAAAVIKLTDDHRATWRSRHARPDPDDIARLTNAWLAGVPATTVPVTRIRPSIRPAQRSARLELLELQVTDPHAFAEAMLRSTLPPGDASYLSGDYTAATAAYLTRIRESPDDAHAWVGLGLALKTRGIPSAEPILACPEVVVALYNDILHLTGSAPDPLRLAGWLGARQVAGTEHSGR